MLAVTSYTTLLAAVESLAEDVGTELSDYLPVAIDNAENRLSRELDFLGTDYISSNISLTAGSSTIAKPTGHKVTYFIKTVVPSTGVEAILERKQDDYLIEYYAGSTTQGTPKYYSDKDETSFRVVPPTSQTLTVVVHGVKRPTALSTGNETNAYTRLCPDVLLYATMLEIALWQRNDAMYAKYEPVYNNLRDGINNEGRRQRRDNGSPAGNPESGRNTLLNGQ